MARSQRAALWPLLFGNFIIGTGVMAPAGLITELSAAFAVDVAAVGSLIAWGGALLCLEAPLVAFATSRLDRRVLLAFALLLFAAGHLASAFATGFSALLAIRLVMIVAVACFTPQAASAVALFVPAGERAGAIAFIFLGWSLASAIGLPLVNLLGALAGWRPPYLLLAAAGLLTAAAVFLTLPAGLKPHRLSPGAWFRALLSRRIWRLLFVSGLLVAGQALADDRLRARHRLLGDRAACADAPAALAEGLRLAGQDLEDPRFVDRCFIHASKPSCEASRRCVVTC